MIQKTLKEGEDFIQKLISIPYVQLKSQLILCGDDCSQQMGLYQKYFLDLNQKLIQSQETFHKVEINQCPSSCPQPWRLSKVFEEFLIWGIQDHQSYSLNNDQFISQETFQQTFKKIDGVYRLQSDSINVYIKYEWNLKKMDEGIGFQKQLNSNYYILQNGYDYQQLPDRLNLYESFTLMFCLFEILSKQMIDI